jgi:hypothetical protein
MALVASMPLMSACSSVEKEPIVKTVFVAPDLPPIASAPDPKLSDPPRGRILGQKEITGYWNDDRTGLKACLVQKHAAVAAITGAAK